MAAITIVTTKINKTVMVAINDLLMCGCVPGPGSPLLVQYLRKYSH